MERVYDLDDGPWFHGDDFNEILVASKKRWGWYKSLGQLMDFWNTLLDCDLEDLGFVGDLFT